MIFLSLRVTADAEGGLKIRAHQRPVLQGIGGGSHQQARAGYIPAHCLLLPPSLPAHIHRTGKLSTIQKLYFFFSLTFQINAKTP